MKILAFMKYGSMAASTRQRLSQYEPILKAARIEVEQLPLLTNAHMENIAEGRKPSYRSVVARYMQRLYELVTRRDFDVLWVHCELFPHMPGFLERLAFASGKPVVFDYDDAIFHMYDEHRNYAVRALLAQKLRVLLRKASLCCCGNAYLRRYAAQYNENSVILPTVVDTTIYQPARRRDRQKLVIGWIGSPSTWKYVAPLLPLLKDLCSKHQVVFRAIGAGPANNVRFDGLELKRWQEENEVRDVQDMDIGIMPLPDESWARGKCGYKLIQYMACGLPVVASPVGVNEEIVQPGENGFLATDLNDWRLALERLIADAEMRARYGLNGRKRVEQNYSLQVTGSRLVKLLRQLQPPAEAI